MTNSEFIKKVADLVAKYAPSYGVKVYSPIIAQACLESAYGTSELAVKANNYFGLKYNASVSDKAAYVKVGSEQNPDGSYVSSVMKWCNFNSFESGVEGYFKFLFKRAGITRYENLKGVTDPDKYIELIKADGYATSLSYVTSLKSVVKNWNLTQYDPKEVNTMSESSLVSYTKWTNNYTKVTNKKNNYIIPHVYVGQVTTVNGVNHFSTNCNASCTYVIGTDGTIGQVCSESNRSWCTGGGLTVNGYTGSKIDYESITFEMACDAFAPYALNAKVRASMVKLMADCAKRNGMGELKWRADKTLVGRPDLQNVLAHRWFAQKSCIPVDSEVLTRDGWVKLADIQIGDEIACPSLDGLRISFEEVTDKVEPKYQDTYTSAGLTATMDHRMVYSVHNKQEYRIDYFKNLLDYSGNVYIPMAGHINAEGLPITDSMLQFLVAVQADGHYMYDKRTDGTKSYYGIEFHMRKERKINRIKECIEACNFEYKITNQSDGSTKIRIYNQDDVNIVEDICEKWLNDKCFTWEWLNLSEEQALFVLNELLLWDGCTTANLYTSRKQINLDVISAIAALNGIGSNVCGSNVSFRENPYCTLGEPIRNNKRNNNPKALVSCVTVKTGIFLCRQNGKTFVVGNCPGDWTYNQMGALVDEANALNGYKTNWKQYDKGSASPAAPTIVVTPTSATDTVRGVQTFLNTYYKSGLVVDGAFGPASKKALAKAFQTELNKLGAGIAVDGDFGPASQKAFETKVGILKNGSRGIFVTLWQCLLRGFGQNPNGIDGIFGSGTTAATNLLFKSKGLVQDSAVSGSDVNKMI